MISITAFICPLIGIGFIIAIIVLIVRSAMRPATKVAPGMPAPFNVVTELAADGFWVRSFEPGSVIRYVFWAQGRKRAEQVIFRPGKDGRQFIYTGVRPERVDIVQATDASGTFVTGTQADIIDDGPDLTGPILGGMAASTILEASAPPPPPQFPSAY